MPEKGPPLEGGQFRTPGSIEEEPLHGDVARGAGLTPESIPLLSSLVSKVINLEAMMREARQGFLRESARASGLERTIVLDNEEAERAIADLQAEVLRLQEEVTRLDGELTAEKLKVPDTTEIDTFTTLVTSTSNKIIAATKTVEITHNDIDFHRQGKALDFPFYLKDVGYVWKAMVPDLETLVRKSEEFR